MSSRANAPVLVVGCSGEIGTTVCSELIASGRQVIGIDEADSPSANGFESFVQADLRDPKAAAVACEKVRAGTPNLWGIIYNAGIYPIVSFDDYTAALWDEVNNVNVRAAFILIHNLHHKLVTGGRIIAVASGASRIGSRDVGYSASKAGLVGLTRSLALILAARNIQVNAICPGPIETAMSARMPAERVAEYKNRIPLGRFGRPAEVSVVVQFLLDPANTYLTGAVIDVNGGLYFA